MERLAFLKQNLINWHNSKSKTKSAVLVMPFLNSAPHASSRGRLARQYFIVFVVLLGGGLITSGVLELFFRYRESREQITVVQGEIASGAAQRIAQFILTIEEHMKAATLSGVIARKGIGEDYQFELAKLLATAPAVAEVLAIGMDGQVRAFASRFRVSPSGEEQDFSRSASFLQAKQGVTFFGPVNFVDESEPSITIAVPIERFPGNVVGTLQAEVDLRQIWEVVRDLKFSAAGYAYIVSRSGDLIAHSYPGLVSQRLRAAHLSQVQAAFQPNPVAPKSRTMMARDFTGQNVLSSFIFLPNLDWAVFVEQPVSEAHKSLYGSILRTSALLLIGLGMAIVATIFIARRVVRPLEALRRGVERIRKGDLGHRLEIKTGDELQILAEEFNKMAGEIKNSYQGLEDKVEQRTKELVALLDVAASATQSFEIDAVLRQVANKIFEIFELDATRIYLFDAQQNELRVRAVAGNNAQGLFQGVFVRGQGIVGTVADSGEPCVFEDVRSDPRYAELSRSTASRGFGFHFFAVFPIRSKGRILGTIACNGQSPRKLTEQEVRLITSMADQIGPAIDNLNLFEEAKSKSKELEIANTKLQELDKLKSGFVSNVSHELRTPLTAIASFVDNMLDGLTGPLNSKQAHYLSAIKDSTERLARLIHDLLDLSVIESGKIELKLSSFLLSGLILDVANDLKPGALQKSIELIVPSVNGDDMIWADRDKITQVLTNLIGNAIKFTPRGGKVRVTTIHPAANDDWLRISVSDTGPGIPAEEAAKIFDEFYQISRPGEEKAKGVGLGLAICKKLIDMHRGHIGVDSEIGTGSTFYFTVPNHPSRETMAQLL
jgi:signal transduction histidine kinase